MLRGFLILISFFTRILIGNKIEYNEKAFVKGLSLYSLVGLIIGCFLAIGYFIGSYLEIIYIKGLIITAIYIIITGGIHLDGTSDTVDGLFSGRTGDKIFEIMSDSRIGAFGVISLNLVLMSQVLLFSHVNLHTIILAPMIGKASVVVACSNMNYAKKSTGMGTLFVESIKAKELCFNIAIVFVVCALMPGYITNIMSTVMTFICVLFIGKWIKCKISGMTGDTCGFIAEVSQTIFMFLSLVVGRLI